MNKRILSALLALFLALGLWPQTVWAAEETNKTMTVNETDETDETNEIDQVNETGRTSGNSAWEKMSKEEIKALLEANPTDFKGNVFDEEPSCTAPYATGKVTTAALQAAVNRLNALRKIAGVPPVTLSEELSENAQYGAVLMAQLGDITHYPEQPADMEKAFFEQAALAARTSNLSAGITLIEAVDGLMLDDDASNLEAVGHRRWQLNPSMGQVGLGYAENMNSSYKRYTVEKVFDKSGAGCQYDFISWPASGNFPTGGFFTSTTPWSITVNPEKYAAPDQSKITVTLTRASDNESWAFSGSNYTTSDKQYFNVNNQGAGVNNCIIFRPGAIRKYKGRYTVKVDGLETDGASVTDFTYTVDFFDPTLLGEPTEFCKVTYKGNGGIGNMDSQTQTMTPYDSFKLPNSAFTKKGFTFAGWSDGIITYQAGDSYTMPAYDVTFTAQWKETGSGSSSTAASSFHDIPANTYYADAVVWAIAQGITTGTSDTTFAPNAPCTRAQIVTFLWRANGSPMIEQDILFTDVPSDSYYYNAVKWAVAQGITTGASATAFSPDTPCTRAQTMAFLYRAAGSPTMNTSYIFTNVFKNFFTDLDSDAYYFNAVGWAFEKGITTGTSATTFSPENTCTRAQVVTFLYRNLVD